MSSDWERGYQAGFQAGLKTQSLIDAQGSSVGLPFAHEVAMASKPKKRKKLSAYNRFVKECAKKPRFKYKSGKRRGMLNMKAIGQAWRKKRK